MDECEPKGSPEIFCHELRDMISRDVGLEEVRARKKEMIEGVWRLLCMHPWGRRQRDSAGSGETRMTFSWQERGDDSIGVFFAVRQR